MFTTSSTRTEIFSSTIIVARVLSATQTFETAILEMHTGGSPTWGCFRCCVTWASIMLWRGRSPAHEAVVRLCHSMVKWLETCQLVAAHNSRPASQRRHQSMHRRDLEEWLREEGLPQLSATAGGSCMPVRVTQHDACLSWHVAPLPVFLTLHRSTWLPFLALTVYSHSHSCAFLQVLELRVVHMRWRG